MCAKSGFKDFKVLKTLTANLNKQLTSTIGCSAFNSIVSCCNWSSYQYTKTSKQVTVFSLFAMTRGQSRNDTQGDNSYNLRIQNSPVIFSFPEIQCTYECMTGHLIKGCLSDIML